MASQLDQGLAASPWVRLESDSSVSRSDRLVSDLPYSSFYEAALGREPKVLYSNLLLDCLRALLPQFLIWTQIVGDCQFLVAVGGFF